MSAAEISKSSSAFCWMWGTCRLRQHDGALLQQVADAQLWCADVVAGRDVADLGMVDDEAVREGGVGLDDDVVLGTL
jgi:hypothetical protein